MYEHWPPFVLQTHNGSPQGVVNGIPLENDACDTHFSASGSKSTKNRWHCSWNAGWNTFMPWVFIAQILLWTHGTSCGSVNSDQCAPGVSTLGKTWPQGDIFLEYGQSLRIYCMLNEIATSEPFQGRNASNLVFFRNDVIVGPEYISIVNETTIMLKDEHPSPSRDIYYCRFRSNQLNKVRYEAICLNWVAVGFKPEKPTNFSCVSYNWERLVCTWEPASNYIPTRSTLRYELPSRIGRLFRFRCPNLREAQESNTCLWNEMTEPIYRKVAPNYTFILTVENTLGTKEFIYGFDHFANVIPSKPEDLTVVNKTSTSVLLRWAVPFSMRNFPSGLHHKISHKNLRNSDEAWQTVYITNNSRINNNLFNLTDLQHANTAYSVRISMKSAKAVDEDKWGNFSEITFKTAPTLPGVAPKTDIGSFEIAAHSANRDVYIYWQTIPEHLQNGDNFTYQIVHVEEDDRQVGLQPIVVGETYAKFEGISFNSLKFEIVATNCVGTSTHKAVVQVPSQLKVPQKPIVFTKIAFDNGIYELSWSPPTDSDVSDYTIFWCENDRDRPYQCSGYLDWVHVSNNSNVYNITIPNPKRIYQFALAANTAQASSGMVWFSSSTTLSHSVGKMTSVWINHTESDTVGVRWDFEYSGRIGIIEGFGIYYCSVASSGDGLACEGPKMSKLVKGNPQTYYSLISDLKPDTTYRMTVSILTKDGAGLDSDAIYVTTLAKAKNLLPENTGFHDIPALLYSDINVPTAIEQKSSVVEVIAKLKQYCHRTVGNFETDVQRDLDSTSMNCTTLMNEVASVISALRSQITSLATDNSKLRENCLKCNEIQ